MGFLLTELAQRQGRKDVEGEKVEGREREKDGEPEERQVHKQLAEQVGPEQVGGGDRGKGKGKTRKVVKRNQGKPDLFWKTPVSQTAHGLFVSYLL